MSDTLMTYDADVLTGTAEYRPFTDEELAQREADQQAQAMQEASRMKAVQARSAAIAHAKSLGFTDDMIAVMYPSIVA